jgi:ureidoacrylate peracid hydrolase
MTPPSDAAQGGTETGRLVTIEARPAPIAVDPPATVVLVVDMQNDFASEGGLFHRAGIDISMIQHAVAPTAATLRVARSAGMKVVYLKMGFNPDLSDVGGPESPNRVRHLMLGVGRAARSPTGADCRFLIRDTWNTDILAPLAPQAGDVVIYKHRFSGFYQTHLDATLKDLGTRYLIVTGCTTSVCVESTIRDAMFRDYSCVVLADCTAEPIGHDLPRSNHAASLLVIQALFGWVSESAAFIQAVEQAAPMTTASGG